MIMSDNIQNFLVAVELLKNLSYDDDDVLDMFAAMPTCIADGLYTEFTCELDGRFILGFFKGMRGIELKVLCHPRAAVTDKQKKVFNLVMEHLYIKPFDKHTVDNPTYTQYYVRTIKLPMYNLYLHGDSMDEITKGPYYMLDEDNYKRFVDILSCFSDVISKTMNL